MRPLPQTSQDDLQQFSNISEFAYEQGYRLSVADMGKEGVKVELFQTEDESHAVILPPEKARECGEWLLGTLGQSPLPHALADILDRLAKQRVSGKSLRAQDKKLFSDAARLLRKRY